MKFYPVQVKLNEDLQADLELIRQHLQSKSLVAWPSTRSAAVRWAIHEAALRIRNYEHGKAGNGNINRV